MTMVRLTFTVMVFIPLAVGALLVSDGAAAVGFSGLRGAGTSLGGDLRPGWGNNYGPNLMKNRTWVNDTRAADPLPKDNHIRSSDHQDVQEKMRGAVNVVTEDARDYLNDQHVWVHDLLDSTCQRVCMRCIFESLGMGRKGCQCAGNCLQGPDAARCERGVPNGWTRSQVTAPKFWWQATCGGGDKDCVDECLDPKFKAEVNKCRFPDGSMDATCIHTLGKMYAPFLANTDGRVFCTHDRLQSCDIFYTAPANTSRVWSCFRTWKRCHNSKMPSSYGSDPRYAHSVWESIPPKGSR